jgi:predicted transcriptional regulator
MEILTLFKILLFYYITLKNGLWGGSMQELLVGEVIRRKRIEMELTQEELWESICETFTISRIENGKQPPSRSTADALLQRLGTSDATLFFKTMSMKMRKILKGTPNSYITGKNCTFL